MPRSADGMSPPPAQKGGGSAARGWLTPGRLLALFCIVCLAIYLDRGMIGSNGVNGSPGSPETPPQSTGASADSSSTSAGSAAGSATGSGTEEGGSGIQGDFGWVSGRAGGRAGGLAEVGGRVGGQMVCAVVDGGWNCLAGHCFRAGQLTPRRSWGTQAGKGTTQALPLEPQISDGAELTHALQADPL